LVRAVAADCRGRRCAKARSFLVDGEAVCCDEDGVAVFQKLRIRRDDSVFLYAFDLLELDGIDLRREAIEVRKEALANLLHSKGELGLQLNEHFHEAGDVIFRHACKLGLEGIVSKRLGSRYRSGRSPDWLKMKNPNAPAVKREAEEDWGKSRWR
jgi:bifunctional non-homologous end joining protein LigD